MSQPPITIEDLLSRTDRLIKPMVRMTSAGALLKPWDPTKPCPCESTEGWYHFEYGYMRWTKITVETDDETGTPYPHGWTKGWDDMSEDAAWGVMVCRGCEQAYRLVEPIRDYD